MGALPLDLLDFDGEVQEKTNHLFWKTANEIGIEVFHLERSSDGIDFETLAKIPAQSESIENYYEWTDTAPLTKAWYRLKIIEKSGRVELSDIIFLEKKSDTPYSIQIYPIPAVDQLFIEFETAKKEKVHLSLFSVTTPLITSLIVQSESGGNTTAFPLENLPSGMYLLNVAFENGKVVTKKVVLDKP